MPDQINQGDPRREGAPLDISAEITEALASEDSYGAKREIMRSDRVRNAPSLTITLDYTTLADARWVKAFLQQGRGQDRKAWIRATEAQHAEAANEFGSGIEWIKVEE